MGHQSLKTLLVEAAAAGAALTLAAGGYAFAANWPTSQIFGETLLGSSDPNDIALTYDDGPNDPYTFRLLDVLERHGVRATFFLIGRFVRARPGIVREIQQAGHLLGNHTMTHPVLLWQSPKRVREELTACSRAIEDATGGPVRYFRPPHGARRPDILRAARELGMTPVMWNALGYDWTSSTGLEIAARVEKGLRKNQNRGRGSNVLLHDGGQAHLGMNRGPTVEATRLLLERWSAPGGERSLRLGRLDELENRTVRE